MKTITKEELLEFGMKEVTTSEKVLYPMEKILGENDEGVLALCITHERNQAEFALKLPNGDTLFLGGCESIDELKILEKCITDYEPNF